MLDKKDALQKLIDNTPLYVLAAAGPKKLVAIELKDDLPSTVAEAFEVNSPVMHRYNRFDGWSIFHDGKYQLAEDAKEIRLHIRKFIARCKVKRCKKDKGGGFTSYTEKLKKQSSGFVSDILESVMALPDVHILPGKKAPCSLDGAINAQSIIAANNVLIDISTRPHVTHAITEAFYTMNYLTYDYKKGVFGEKFAKFLVDITKGDVNLMVLLQQWCGYLLLPTLKYQKFLLCVGDGANGKGVFFDTITAALGTKNVSNVPLARFKDSAALFGTYHKLVNMSNESANNLTGDAESALKEYVAGDKMLWEQKYKDAFFDYPTAKLMFATNELPKIRDATDGIWRRMILVPFDAQFKGDAQNPGLCKELQGPDELAGVLNWMIEGAEMLARDGRFIEPDRCREALGQYRDESNSARMYLNDQIETDGSNMVAIPCTWLHGQYQIWCKANGFRPLNNVHFGKVLVSQYNAKKSRPTIGEKRFMCYDGIKPLEGTELDVNLVKWYS